MAKKNKFDRAVNDKFEKTVQRSNETAVVKTVKKVRNENLFDYIYNTEDITDTSDLEESINQLGFLDPIEVTDYGMPDGNFTILSGHRRRAAGVKQGITIFPCLVWTFNSEAEIRNYVLLANSHRDSSKDPLLIAKRYREHKNYLQQQGHTHNFREEIAKRLGLSKTQADRYHRLLDVIPEVWGLIQTNIVGVSSVIKMSLYNEEQQQEILTILMDCHSEGLPLSRERCEKIISAYSQGIKSYTELRSLGEAKKYGIDKFDNSADNAEDEYDIHDDIIGDSNNEQQEIISESTAADNSKDNKFAEFNEFAADKVINDRRINTNVGQFSDRTANDGEGFGNNTDITKKENEYAEGEDKKQDNKTMISDIEQQHQKGFNIKKTLDTLETNFNEVYAFNSEETAVLTVQAIKNMIKIMLEESERICIRYNNKDLFDNDVKELADELKKYIVT